MPKGVEHIVAIYLPENTDRVESLMPKGVEHQCLGLLKKQDFLSVESLMPKGVEH